MYKHTLHMSDSVYAAWRNHTYYTGLVNKSIWGFYGTNRGTDNLLTYVCIYRTSRRSYTMFSAGGYSQDIPPVGAYCNMLNNDGPIMLSEIIRELTILGFTMLAVKQPQPSELLTH